MNAKAVNVRRIRFLHEAEDAVGYEILSTTNYIRIAQDGSMTPGIVSASAFRRQGREREQLRVNENGKDSEYCLVLVMNGAKSYPQTGLSSKTIASRTPARFDLVKGPLKSGSYLESDILATLPIFVQKDGEDGSSAWFTSMVFKRSDTALTVGDTPEGGTYEDPIPEGGGWSDAPSSGTSPLWMSRARFTPEMTGEAGAPLPQWSVPSPCDDSTGIEYIFSRSENPQTPADSHPYVPTAGDEWTKDAADAVWMGVALKNNGVWESWKVVKVKGEKGEPGEPGDKGDDGKDGVVYDIVLSSDVMNIAADGSRTPAVVVGTAWKTSGELRSAVTASDCKGKGLQMQCEVQSETGTRTLTATVQAPHQLGFPSPNAVGATSVVFKLVRTTDSTVFASKALLLQREGQAGDKGIAGPFVPPPRLWSDYPDGYKFMSGDKGEEHLDVVLYRNTGGGYLAATCLVSHTKSAEHDPSKDNTALKTLEQNPYWQAQDGDYELLATKILLAANAYIRLLSSQAIKVFKSDGKTVNVCLGGGDWPFWTGADNPEDAPTKVSADGTLYSRKSVIEGDVVVAGRVKPLVTRITKLNYLNYRVNHNGGIEGSTYYVLDFRKLTGRVVIDKSMNSLTGDDRLLRILVACRYPSETPESVEEWLEEYIGSRLVIKNESNISFGVTGLVSQTIGGSGNSYSIPEGYEIHLLCWIHYDETKKDKSIGWLVEYFGKSAGGDREFN